MILRKHAETPRNTEPLGYLPNTEKLEKIWKKLETPLKKSKTAKRDQQRTQFHGKTVRVRARNVVLKTCTSFLKGADTNPIRGKIADGYDGTAGAKAAISSPQHRAVVGTVFPDKRTKSPKKC